MEVSKDRKHYVQLGHIETTQSTTFAIPSQILPASELWIRLRSSFTKGGSPGAFQIVTYVYSAQLDGNPPDLNGKTYFAELKQAQTTMNNTSFGEVFGFLPSHKTT